jgi:kanamycin nucleotidyltransferase
VIRRVFHEERVRLAGEICDEVKGVLRGDLRAFVIFASVAKDVDGPYSDLEMMAITTDSYEEYCSEFMRDGIRCEVDFVPYKSAIKQAGTVDSFWSVRADQ